jgi:SAM-dependent methyltransferase
VGDLAELDLPARGIAEGFDVIVCAGNVLTFLDPATRRPVLAGFRAHLRDGGRAVVGFGAGRDYPFEEFFADAAAVGLEVHVALATWDLRPFRDGADFLVAILGPQG